MFNRTFIARGFSIYFYVNKPAFAGLLTSLSKEINIELTLFLFILFER